MFLSELLFPLIMMVFHLVLPRPLPDVRGITTTDSGDLLAQVVKVVDGDTIVVQYNTQEYTVRYIGIDTPETVHPQRGVECFGERASQENIRLVAGKTVRLEKDVSDTDRYGRWLRYVYVDDQMVNEALVKDGFAHASSYPPDIRYQTKFTAAQQEAQEHHRGLWAECKQTPTASPMIDQQACAIKGNISSRGEKIYHLPGSREYASTKIDTSNGEQYFCTTQEALEAGWRPAH